MVTQCTTPAVTMHHFTGDDAPSSAVKLHFLSGVRKKQLRFRKTRYRGLEKQRAKFNIMFALANLILADRPYLAA